LLGCNFADWGGFLRNAGRGEVPEYWPQREAKRVAFANILILAPAQPLRRGRVDGRNGAVNEMRLCALVGRFVSCWTRVALALAMLAVALSASGSAQEARSASQFLGPAADHFLDGSGIPMPLVQPES
jgi:hypothetical protein